MIWRHDEIEKWDLYRLTDYGLLFLELLSQLKCQHFVQEGGWVQPPQTEVSLRVVQGRLHLHCLHLLRLWWFLLSLWSPTDVVHVSFWMFFQTFLVDIFPFSGTSKMKFTTVILPTLSERSRVRVNPEETWHTNYLSWTQSSKIQIVKVYNMLWRFR